MFSSPRRPGNFQVDVDPVDNCESSSTGVRTRLPVVCGRFRPDVSRVHDLLSSSNVVLAFRSSPGVLLARGSKHVAGRGLIAARFNEMRTAEGGKKVVQRYFVGDVFHTESQRPARPAFLVE